jgi:hypothetical protein
MEYVCDELWHTLLLPAIAPGCVGVGDTLTFKTLGELAPQALLAVTEILPPALPAVAEMEVEVEVPDQPAGRFHV